MATYYARLIPQTDPKVPRPRRVVIGNKRYVRFEGVDFIQTWYECASKAEHDKLSKVTDERGNKLFEVTDQAGLDEMIRELAEKAIQKRRARSIGRPAARRVVEEEPEVEDVIHNDVDDSEDEVEDAVPASFAPPPPPTQAKKASKKAGRARTSPSS